jgi:hypothetical protein
MPGPDPGHPVKMPRRRIVVAALGITPSAAYTAIVNVLPTHVFLIPSRDTPADLFTQLKAKVEELGLTEIFWELCPFPAEWKGLPTVIELAQEIGAKIRPILPGEIVYNIGGGSAATQLAIAALYFLAGGSRYASIDEREPAARRADPFYIAEWRRIDFG